MVVGRVVLEMRQTRRGRCRSHESARGTLQAADPQRRACSTASFSTPTTHLCTMSGYMDDVEPIAVSGPGAGGGAWARSGSTSSLGKRTRTDSPGLGASSLRGTGSAAGTPGPSGSTSGGGAAAPVRPRTPEPDEDIDMRDADTQMWLVRVPRFLKETWSSVSEPDAKLGFVRVYE